MKRFFLALLAFALFLGGCSARKGTDSPDAKPPAASPSSEERLLVLEGRRYSFDGSAEELSAREDRLILSAGGTYRIRGTLTEGSIQVSAPPDATVHLILDSVSVTSSYHSPLFLEEAACVILELERGTVNRLTDRSRSVAAASYPAGCLVSRCDLILRGAGTLCISGRQETALVCRGDLSLSEASLSVSAPSSGVWVRDRLRMESGSLTVSSAKLGVVTGKGDAAEGILDFSGGRLTLSCSQVALVASSYIKIGETQVSISAPTKYQAPKVYLPDNG